MMNQGQIVLRNDLRSFFKQIMHKRKTENMSVFNYDVALKYLERYSRGKKIPLKIIDSQWVQSFQDFLTTSRSLKNGKILSALSAHQYHNIVTRVIRVGIEASLIRPDALKGLKSIERKTHVIEPLSFSELQSLATTKCDSSSLKRAFLFSALTGMPWKEITSLTWNHVKSANDNVYIHFGDDPRFIPVTKDAFELINGEQSKTENVFNIKWNTYMYIKLNKWAIRAGILRNIKFETARVTFARLLHDRGVPIELISELIGHRCVKSTMRLISN